MANIATLLKEEITRLARKEIRHELEAVKKATTRHRSEISELKRRVGALEQQVARLGKANARHLPPAAEAQNGSKLRFTVNGFKSLRKRLGLTAEAAGTLLEVSAQTVYNWEGGNAKPRALQLQKIAALRAMGKREIAALLEKSAE